MNDDPLLIQLKVKAADRQQQVWERNSLSIELWSEKIFIQKLNYIHNNPVQNKWKPDNYFSPQGTCFNGVPEKFILLISVKIILFSFSSIGP